LAASASALLAFAQMRLLDEFKDSEDDARYRPYRAVPRGLVTLPELGAVFVAVCIAQIAIGIAVDVRLLWLLAALWAYLALMTVEFCARDWLRRRPFAYLASHNPIGALITLYAAAFEWLPRAADPHPALALLAVAVFCNTALLEIGRKIRAPHDEEPGVVTYSRAWGAGRSVGAWLAALASFAVAGAFAARTANQAATFAALMSPVAVASGIYCWRYLRRPETRYAKAIEGLSGLATIALYGVLGPIAAIF
jgi:4-hydroxybenzoate polyprenyltransferase